MYTSDDVDHVPLVEGEAMLIEAKVFMLSQDYEIQSSLALS